MNWYYNNKNEPYNFLNNQKNNNEKIVRLSKSWDSKNYINNKNEDYNYLYDYSLGSSIKQKKIDIIMIVIIINIIIIDIIIVIF